MELLIVSLRRILELNKDGNLNNLKSVLSSFSCKRNKDEETFIQSAGPDGAIDFEKRNRARTYLVINKNDNKLIGYFSLAIKTIELMNVSGSKKRAITAGNSKVNTYPAYLIGHLAKDDSVKEKIGCEIIKMAVDLIYSAQNIVGGRLAYLDCKDIKKLIEFYENIGFKFLGKSKSGLNQYYIALKR